MIVKGTALVVIVAAIAVIAAKWGARARHRGAGYASDYGADRAADDRSSDGPGGSAFSLPLCCAGGEGQRD
jgi:hypothetical protein